MASAVPLFNGLKHLPCPKEAGGASCTTTGCLFGHARDDQNRPPEISLRSLDGAVDGGDSAASAHNESPPAKRQKIASSDHLYDPFSPPVVNKSHDAQRDRHGESHNMPPDSTPVSTPIKKSALAVLSPSTQQPKTPMVSTPAKAKTSPLPKPSASPASSTPVVTRKLETLNPRLLKSAPATHGTRYKLLCMLHSDLARLNTEVSNKSIKDPQLKKFLISDQELIWMALDREQEVATQRAAIYTNIMKQDVMKYKRMSFDAWVAERSLALEKKAAPKNPSIGAPVVINTHLTPEQEVHILTRLITPINNLERHGYVPTVPTDDQIKEAKAAVDLCAGWEKCDRCTARFQVFPGRNIETGELASGGKCTHHPGRTYFPERQRGDTTHIPKKYRCCEEDVGESLGCTVGQNHVWKANDPTRLATLWNFVSTPANDHCPNKAVAFDCEMGYTVYGMELVRLTATSWPDGAELVDVLVQPFGEVLDLNSKYSGVFPEDLARAVPWSVGGKPPSPKPGERKILQMVSSPEVARDLFFSIISPETILIGHGLENDLNAMRMVHPKIVDTVLLYPHRRGLPIRMGLKVLMEQQLNRRIQVDTGEGHDSAEDARAAGDLVRFKIQKEWASMQSDGWKLVDGVIRPSGWKPAIVEQQSEASYNPDDGDGARLTKEPLVGKM